MGYNLQVLHHRFAEDAIIELRIPAMAGRDIAKKVFKILNAEESYNKASGKGDMRAYYAHDLPDEREVREAIMRDPYDGKEDIVSFLKKAKSLAAAQKGINPIYISFN